MLKRRLVILVSSLTLLATVLVTFVVVRTTFAAPPPKASFHDTGVDSHYKQPRARTTLRAANSVASAFQITGQLWAYDAAADNAPVEVWDVGTENLVTTFVPRDGNGRGIAYDPTDGNIWTTTLEPGTFNGDGLIHKNPALGGPDIATIPDPGGAGGPGIGALAYDAADHTLWAAAYLPVNGQSLLYQLDPTTGAVLQTCSLPFKGGGEGNDTLAIARPADLGGTTVLLTDGGELLNTLYALDINTCAVVKTYPVPIGVSGIAVDAVTGDLIATDTANFYNLGLAPYTSILASFRSQGIPEGITLGQGTTSITPNPPQSVHATTPTDNAVTVSWQPPVDNGSPVTGYEVISLNSFEFAPGAVAGSVAGDVTSLQVTGLHDCQETEWAVEAVNAQNNVSGPAFALENFPYGVWPHGAPHRPPSIVVILAPGLGSSNPGGTYAPLGDVPTYCSYTGGPGLIANGFPAPLAAAMNYFQGDPVSTFGYRTRLTDALAGNDAVILPFSYNGARFQSKQSNPANPQFVVAPYSTADPANTRPDGAAAWMAVEVISIHKTWPNAAIYIIGHSNGGLVAEDWWLNTGQTTPDGVVHVWALDSPLNGVAKVGVICTVLFCPAPLGRAVTQTYTSLWKNQATQDPADLAADLNGMFIPVGTVGDPVYDLADVGSADGLVSQIYFNEPTCANSGFDFPPCEPQAASVISPCTPPSNLNFGQKHGVVMNCQGLIKQIASIVGESV